MEKKLYTKEQIKDAIWQELKESGYTGDNNDRAYEVIGIVVAGIEKITPAKAQPAPRWVKARVNYPEKDGKYYIREGDTKSAANLYQYTKEYWQATEMEWLDESAAPAAGREEDRNEFAEWCRMQPNYGFVRGMGWMCSVTHEYFTTDFMYELFKQQKK